MAIKLSKTSKMPGKSWSLPAWETCPGARDKDNSPVPACKRCYALTGAYTWPTTIKAREHNLKDWKRSDWVADMAAAINRQRQPFFRWFDSGDCYTPELAKKIREVCKATPSVKHWIPSRSYKIPAIYLELNKAGRLPNVVVRWSSDSTSAGRLSFGRNSTILQSKEDFNPAKGYSLCRAGERGGKCQSCRACWSKKVKTVAYVAHGSAVNPAQFTKPLAV